MEYQVEQRDGIQASTWHLLQHLDPFKYQLSSPWETWRKACFLFFHNHILVKRKTFKWKVPVVRSYLKILSWDLSIHLWIGGLCNLIALICLKIIFGKHKLMEFGLAVMINILVGLLIDATVF